MKHHYWSRPLCYYECLDFVVCKNCGAKILLISSDANPYNEYKFFENFVINSCKQSNLPLDCDLAEEAMKSPDYKGLDEDDGAWMDEQPRWD